MCHLCGGTCKAHVGQKRTPEPLKLELQMVVSRLVWELRTELGSSARAAGARPPLQP